MKKSCLILFITLFMSLFLSIPVQANSAEPPGVVIIVNNAPADLTLTLQFSESEQYEMTVSRKGWESYYKLYYHSSEFF